MAKTRSYMADGQFAMTDLTSSLLVVPNRWGLVNSLGIFSAEPISTYTFTYERIEKSLAQFGDKPRGEHNTVSKDYERSLYSYAVPHFPFDDAVRVQDIQDKRAFGRDEAETEAEVIFRKIERIRESHARLLETARCQAINHGTVYAPNGSVNYNWYTEFGVTRKDVDFTFGTTTTNMIEKCEEAIAHIQDTLKNGQIASDFIAICSPGFFSKLIGHTKVREAYLYYATQPELLRKRLTAQGLDARYRAFDFGGIMFIEYRGTDVNENVYITANECRILPIGVTEGFVTYFAPADKFDYANTLGQEAYLFQYRDPKGSLIELESQSNFLNMLRYPQCVVRGYSSN